MKRKVNPGFTLIEILVSMTAFGIVSVIMSQSFFSIIKANFRAELTKSLKQSGDFAERSMEKMIRENVGVSSACADSTTSELQIVTRTNETVTYKCLWDTSGAIDVARIASVSGAMTTYLTPTTVTLGGTAGVGNACSGATLEFHCSHPSGQPTSVRLEYTLYKAGTSTNGVTYRTTIDARNY